MIVLFWITLAGEANERMMTSDAADEFIKARRGDWRMFFCRGAWDVNSREYVHAVG